MRKILKQRAILLSLMMAVFLFTPIFSKAQERGLFDYGDASTKKVENESLFSVLRSAGVDWDNGGLIPQDPTQEAPLGSGIFVIVAVSAGYVLVKSKGRKEEQ